MRSVLSRKKRDEIIFQKEQEKKKSFSQNIFFFAERAAFAFKKRGDHNSKMAAILMSCSRFFFRVHIT